MDAPDLSESLEDYLEAILVLAEQQERVGTGTVAEAMGVKPASATRALKELAERGLIEREPYGAIAMSEAGRELATRILEKHRALEGFFRTLLGVDDERISTIACHLEHAIPEDIIQRLIAFADFLYRCPRGQVLWHGGEPEEGGGISCRGRRSSCPSCGPEGDSWQLLADLESGEAQLRAFCDAGELHRRFLDAGFSIGGPLRLLSHHEGVITVLGEEQAVFALSEEEARLVLVSLSKR